MLWNLQEDDLTLIFLRCSLQADNRLDPTNGLRRIIPLLRLALEQGLLRHKNTRKHPDSVNGSFQNHGQKTRLHIHDQRCRDKIIMSAVFQRGASLHLQHKELQSHFQEANMTTRSGYNKYRRKIRDRLPGDSIAHVIFPKEG